MSLTTVRLYGILRAKFGREYQFAVNSAAEAVQALCSQIQGFEKFLRMSDEMGFEFAVFRGKKNLNEEGIVMQSSEPEIIRISPVVKGSKRSGLLTTIAGVGLIALGAFTGGTTSALGMGLISAGAGIAVAGVVQMLYPMPDPGTVQEEDGNEPSSGFGGPVTTTAQGHPVPLLYGRREVGGAVISGSISTEDQIEWDFWQHKTGGGSE